MSYPAYLELARKGKLRERAEEAYKLLQSCSLCPRRCGVDRFQGQRGFCGAGERAKVYKFKIHLGEEPPISGWRGSGVIFFSGCPLKCIYCQNYPFSHQEKGREISPLFLSRMMLYLQKMGCHNLNLVTPTHFVPQILSAVKFAVDNGFHLPIVYNTSGYESLQTLRLIDGVVDIYLSDFKYSQADVGKKYSQVWDYPQVAEKAIKEMYRQVGNLLTDQNGIAKRGLIIRHLLLPNNLSGSEEIFSFIARELSPSVFISLMGQYLPLWRAKAHPSLGRKITIEEFKKAFMALELAGLENGWIQELPTSPKSKSHPLTSQRCSG